MHAIVRAHAQLDGLALADRPEACFQPVDRIGQLRHAVRGGEPVGQAQRIVGEPVERDLDLHERSSRLHERAERHLAGEIFWRPEQKRNNRRQNQICAVEPHHPTLPNDHTEPTLDEIEGYVQARAFVVVAADQCDVFGIVLHAGQLVAQLCFTGRLFLDAAHQRPAQQEHAERRDRAVDDAGEYHVAGME